MTTSIVGFDEIRQKWLREQLELASLVSVLEDDWTQMGQISEDQDFRLLATDTHSTEPEYFGGVDVSFPDNEADPSVAVYVVVDRTTMNVVYQDHEYFHLTMPYIPSFLAFREIEPIERLIQKQKSNSPALTPRAILVDGNGILHPRKAGIACFVGVRTAIPAIGIGKTLFCQGGLTRQLVEDDGVVQALQRAASSVATLSDADSSDRILFDKRPICATKHASKSSPEKKGGDKTSRESEITQSLAELAPHCRGLAIPLECRLQGSQDETHVLACALVAHGGRVTGRNSKTKVGGTKNPIYVSVGHGLSLSRAVLITAALSVSRIPEPVRQADLIGRRLLRTTGKN